MADPVLSVRGLEKQYRDGTHAVQGVDFDVEAGEVFGLLGPNGAGKTTIMKILGTMHRPTAGHARVLGLDPVRDAPAIRRRIGFAMQEVGMDDLATAWEMLLFHARLYRLPKWKAEKRARDMLHEFDLYEHRHRRVTRFSGGMQRRLDLAVSIIHGPELLFLDEPSTGLDPKSRSDLWAILRRLQKEHGLTILMSTHYMDEAEALCDRLAIMARGRVVAIDTAANLKRSIGADRVRVRTERPLTAAQGKALASALGAKRTRIQGDIVEISVPEGDQALMPVLQAVDRAGAKVVSTRVLSPTLDDVYLKYTGSRMDPPDPARPAGATGTTGAAPGAVDE